MAKTRQLNLGSVSEQFHEYWRESGRMVHGGEHAMGKRKTRRPFHSKKPIHLVLRAENAQGDRSLQHRPRQVRRIIDQAASRYGVRLYEYSNNGNHLHLLIRARSRPAFQKFLRVTTGLIARAILKAKKGAKQGKYWAALAFTRVADWGQPFRNLKEYVVQNVLEAAGIIPYRPRQPSSGFP